MYRNNDYIYDAVFQLSDIAGIEVDVDSNRIEYDAIVSIGKFRFVVIAKPEVRASNQGIVLHEINEIKNRTGNPVLVVAKYIALEVAEKYREEGINYIDSAGNAYLRHNDFFIFVKGQKILKVGKTNQSRAFQEAGIKLIFCLLVKPDNLKLSYRRLADIAGISIGSVSMIMKELEELHFILKTGSQRVLKNTSELLQRWIVAYHDVLRPRVIKKRMRFSSSGDYTKWRNLPLHKSNGMNLWGSEPAAALLTGQLQPEKFSIYTNNNWQSTAKDLKLIPDEKGDVEILYIFWNVEAAGSGSSITPALLVYADLMASSHERNIEIAKQILENELQYIKQ